MDGQLSIEERIGVDFSSGPDTCVVTWQVCDAPSLMRPAAYLLTEAHAKQLEKEGKPTVAKFLRDLAADIRMIQGVK